MLLYQKYGSIFVGVLVAACVLMLGCTETRSVSNKDPGYSQTLNRTLVLAHFPPSTQPFGAALLEETHQRLQQENVRTETMQSEAPEPSASSNAILLQKALPFQRARNMQATTLLAFQEVDRRVLRGRQRTHVDATGNAAEHNDRTRREYLIEAVLYDVQRQRKVWKAEFLVLGSENEIRKREAKSVVKKLVSRLEDDQLLD